MRDAQGKLIRKPQAQMVPPHERVARSVSESTSTETERAELVIRDETKRAILNRKGRPTFRPRIKLQPSGKD